MLSNFCVTPITTFADTTLNDIFTWVRKRNRYNKKLTLWSRTIYGFMAIVLCLLLATLCVIKKAGNPLKFILTWSLTEYTEAGGRTVWEDWCEAGRQRLCIIQIAQEIVIDGRSLFSLCKIVIFSVSQWLPALYSVDRAFVQFCYSKRLDERRHESWYQPELILF